jgi:hypothetical protein
MIPLLLERIKHFIEARRYPDSIASRHVRDRGMRRGRRSAIERGGVA